MIEKLLVKITLLFAFIGVSSVVNAQCNYTLRLNDSWGDGWNGSQEVEITYGSTVDTVTLGNPPGDVLDVVLSVNTNDTINIVLLGGPYTSGSPDWHQEVSVELLDFDGNSIYDSGTDPVPGFLYGTQVNCPSCPGVSNLNANEIMTTSASLIWSEIGSATSWILEYDTSGFVLGTGNSMVVNSDSNNIGGLMSATSYEFYVRSVCGAGDTSNWFGPFAFSTLCNTFSVPFTETFNSGSSTENCWTVVNNNGDGDAWDLNNTTNVYEGDESATMYTDFNGGNNDDYLISPQIVLTGNERLRFYYRARSTGEPNDFEVLLSTNSMNLGDFSNVLLVDTVSSTSYLERIIDLSAYSGNVFIAFHIPNGGLDGWNLYIDDFNVETIPTCNQPTSLNVSMITSNSASLQWTEAGTATSWLIEYDTVGFSQGTGNSMVVANDSINVSGLNPAATYEFYVRALCGGVDSSMWSGPYTFNTLCDAYVATYSQDFDGNVAQTPFGGVACWTTVGPGANDINVSSATDDGVAIPSAPNVVELNDGNLGGGDTAILVSPQFSDLSTGMNQIRFMAHQENGGAGDLLIGVMSDPNDASTLVMYDTITSAELNAQPGFQEYIVYMNNTALIGANQYIAFVHGSDIYELYIDDFIYEPLPSCPAPNGLFVSDIMSNSASFEWTENGSAMQWEIEYDTLGFSQGAGMTSIVNSDSVNVSGLSTLTDYEFYVRAICGAGDTSMWSGPFNFTTLPSCPDPSNLMASGITANTANLYWDENGSAMQWEVEYDVDGFLLGTGNLISSNVDSAIASGLVAATDYDFYVRAVCGAGDTSAWVGPFSFTTPCTIFVPSYNEDFASFTPNCWDEADNGTITNGPGALGTGAWGSSTTFGSSARINLWNLGDRDWLLSPQFDLSGGSYDLILDVAVQAYTGGGAISMGSDDTVYVAYNENGSSWNVLKTFTAGDSIPDSLIIDVTQIPSNGSNVQFGIMGSEGLIDDSEDYWFYVANFAIDTTGSVNPTNCNTPTSLSTDTIVNTTATVSWMENGNATEWEIEYGVAGFSIGAGMSVITTTNPHTLTGLDAQTDYDFYVRAICGAGDTSSVSSSSSFTSGIVSIAENLNSQISVFPNPTINVVNIELDNLNGKTTIELITMTGETVKSLNVKSQTSTFDVSDLPSGVYSVKVQNEVGVGFQKLIIE